MQKMQARGAIDPGIPLFSQVWPIVELFKSNTEVGINYTPQFVWCSLCAPDTEHLWYYPYNEHTGYGGPSLHLTQVVASLDVQCVKKYCDAIIQGARPYVILLTSLYCRVTSSYYLLDGHHKFAAYCHLKMYPPALIIRNGHLERQQPHHAHDSATVESIFPTEEARQHFRERLRFADS